MFFFFKNIFIYFFSTVTKEIGWVTGRCARVRSRIIWNHKERWTGCAILQKPAWEGRYENGDNIIMPKWDASGV